MSTRAKEPTKQEINERLARFMGREEGWNASEWHREWPRYTKSHDLLQPVIEKLSDEQWDIFCEELSDLTYMSCFEGNEALQCAMKATPLQKARALYEAIGEGGIVTRRPIWTTDYALEIVRDTHSVSLRQTEGEEPKEVNDEMEI